MFEVGRLCIKIAGRDAGKTCIVIDVLENNYVLIDGQTRRRKCSTSHLDPLEKVVKIKKNASNKSVVEALKSEDIECKEKVAKEKKEKTQKPKKRAKKHTAKPKKEKVTKKKAVKKAPSKQQKKGQ